MAAPGIDWIAMRHVTLSSYFVRWALLIVDDSERVLRSYSKMSPEERPKSKCRQLLRRESD